MKKFSIFNKLSTLNFQLSTVGSYLSTFNSQLSTSKGFTFIELILYISIVTIMLASIIPFAWNIIGSSSKSSTQQEVNSTARYVSERIKWEIRDAIGINSVVPTSISLAKSNAALNPTIIDLSAGKIRITQGSPGIPYDLNSTDATVTGLTFTDYTSIDNKTKHIGFELTIEAGGSLQRQEFKETVTLRSSAEVRNN